MHHTNFPQRPSTDRMASAAALTTTSASLGSGRARREAENVTLRHGAADDAAFRGALPRTCGPTLRPGSKKARSSRSSTNSIAAYRPSRALHRHGDDRPRPFPVRPGNRHPSNRQFSTIPSFVDQFQVRDARRQRRSDEPNRSSHGRWRQLVRALHKQPARACRRRSCRKAAHRRRLALGNGDQVRLDAVMVANEHGARRPKPVTTSSATSRTSYFWRTAWIFSSSPSAAARCHRCEDRLADEGGNGVGTFGEDHLFQLVGAVLRELLFAHRAIGTAEVVGRFRVQDRRPRQVEGGCGRDEGRSVSRSSTPGAVIAGQRQMIFFFSGRPRMLL